MIDLRSVPFARRTVLEGLSIANKRYYSDNHRFQVTTAGRRSRKTIISMNKLERKALKKGIEGLRGGRYFHGAPTRQQAKAIFWDRLKNNTRELWTRRPLDTELTVFLPFDTQISVFGFDKPERVEGRPWHGGHLTEFGNFKPGSWGNNIRPLFSDTKGFCYIDGVPEGMNDYYDLALKAAGGSIPKTMPLIGAYSENPDKPNWSFHSWFSSDVLDPEDIEDARSDLDPKTFQQEMEGSFLNLKGLCYYGFSHKNYKDCKYVPGTAVHIGIDFNVNPMTATVSHAYGNELHQFSEEYLTDSNTYEMRDTLLKKYGNYEVYIYPDATGGARQTSATETNLDILRNAGFQVIVNSINPFIVDRINCVNAMICSTTGIVRYFLNPKTCPKTKNDLERVERLDNGKENKKQEAQGLVHISSALGYKICYMFPINSGGIYTD